MAPDLQEDIFAKWEVEAREAGVLTSVCGNGELEFGEVCDEGSSTPSGACLSCREILPQYTCKVNMTCEPLCGDGLVFDGLEECDDGGLLQGCSSDCKLLSCSRDEVSVNEFASGIPSSSDPELMATLKEKYHVPAQESSEQLELQGYTPCFRLKIHGQLSDPAKALENCSGATRLSVVGEAENILVRHDLQLESGFDPKVSYQKGKSYLLRYKDAGNATELWLTCHVGSENWQSCLYWGVRPMFMSGLVGVWQLQVPA